MESSPKLGALRRRSEFLHLAKSGKRVSCENWLVINFLPSLSFGVRVGWTVPKQVGTAVIRNRLRRWSRDTLGRKVRRGEIAALDLNIFVRPVHVDFFKKLRRSDFDVVFEKGLERVCQRS